MHLKSESSSLQRGLEVLSAIDEKDSVFDIVSLSQFAEEALGECCRGRREELNVKQVVSFGVCSGVQPELLVINWNHCPVEWTLSWRLTGFWL